MSNDHEPSSAKFIHSMNRIYLFLGIVLGFAVGAATAVVFIVALL